MFQSSVTIKWAKISMLIKKFVSQIKRCLGLCKSSICYSCHGITHEDKSLSSRLGYLDGYRGSLALVVIVNHTQLLDSYKMKHINPGLSHTYGMAGFFMLSALLLTYRLMEELNKLSSVKMVLISLLKYAIRRLFRIYLYFLFYYLFAKIISKWFLRPDFDYKNLY